MGFIPDGDYPLQIDHVGDMDWYTFYLHPNVQHTAFAEGAQSQKGFTLSQPYMEVRNASNQLVVSEDTGFLEAGAYDTFHSGQGGIFYLGVRDEGYGWGTYSAGILPFPRDEGYGTGTYSAFNVNRAELKGPLRTAAFFPSPRA